MTYISVKIVFNAAMWVCVLLVHPNFVHVSYLAIE